jgi:hypothetical protein
VLIRALNLMPPAATFVVVVGVTNAFALIALLAMRKAVERFGFPRNEPIATSTFDRISAFNALVLALVVVTLWTNFRTVQADVNNEAAEMAHLGQDITGFASADRKFYLTALRNYVSGVAFSEWDDLCAGRADPQVERQFEALQQSMIVKKVPQNDGPLRADVLGRLAKLDQLRRARLTSARPVIIGDVWIVLVVMSALILISPYFYKPAHGAFALLMAVLLATALGTVFFLAVRMDDVFCGATAVSPGAIVDVARELAH